MTTAARTGRFVHPGEVWFARGDVVWTRRLRDDASVWPAEVVEVDATTQGPASKGQTIAVHFIGTGERAVVSSLSAVPFAKHMDRYSRESTRPDFQAAVQTAAETDRLRRRSAVLTEKKQTSSPQSIPSSPLRDREPLSSPGEASPLLTGSPGRFRGHPIVRGAKIRIRSVEHIHHKLREYADTDAVIVDVPQHPNTWYGVQLADGKEIKIRKSAFDVVSTSPATSSASPLSASLGSSPSSTSESPRLGRPRSYDPPSLNLNTNQLHFGLGVPLALQPGGYAPQGHHGLALTGASTSSGAMNVNMQPVAMRGPPTITLASTPVTVTASAAATNLTAPLSGGTAVILRGPAAGNLVGAKGIVIDVPPAPAQRGALLPTPTHYTVKLVDGQTVRLPRASLQPFSLEEFGAQLNAQAASLQQHNLAALASYPLSVPSAALSGTTAVAPHSAFRPAGHLGLPASSGSTLLSGTPANPASAAWIGQSVQLLQGLGRGSIGTVVAVADSSDGHLNFTVRMDGGEDVIKRAEHIALVSATAPSAATTVSLPQVQQQPQQAAGSSFSALPPLAPPSNTAASKPRTLSSSSSASSLPPPLPLDRSESDPLSASSSRSSSRSVSPAGPPPRAPAFGRRRTSGSTGSAANRNKPGRAANYVNRFVRIGSGRHTGDIGYVTKGGNGYYTVVLIPGSGSLSSSSTESDRERPQTVMKRSADLQLVSLSADQEENLVSQLSQLNVPLGPSPSPLNQLGSGGQRTPTPAGEDRDSRDSSVERDESPTTQEFSVELLDEEDDRSPFASVSRSASGGLQAPSLSQPQLQVQAQQQARKRKRGQLGKLESWIDRKVTVSAGKYRGEVGTIVKSGHGFYCVEIANRGEVMKRANELEAYDSQDEDEETHQSPPEPVSPHVSTTRGQSQSHERDQGRIRSAAIILMDLMKDRRPQGLPPKIPRNALSFSNTPFTGYGYISAVNSGATGGSPCPPHPVRPTRSLSAPLTAEFVLNAAPLPGSELSPLVRSNSVEVLAGDREPEAESSMMNMSLKHETDRDAGSESSGPGSTDTSPSLPPLETVPASSASSHRVSNTPTKQEPAAHATSRARSDSSSSQSLPPQDSDSEPDSAVAVPAESSDSDGDGESHGTRGAQSRSTSSSTSSSAARQPPTAEKTNTEEQRLAPPLTQKVLT